MAFGPGGYVMRVEPRREQEVLGKVDAALGGVSPNRIIHDRLRSDRRNLEKQSFHTRNRI
jgi:hypothetical protein